MFYSITGKVVHAAPGLVAIDVGGVAFKCSVTMTAIQALQGVKNDVTLFTHLNVREDALDLFGFLTAAECNCFKMLTAISGVGPKAGLAILSELTAEQVAIAAASGDTKQFARANGVGPKLAQRIVLELRDKVKDFSFAPEIIDGAASVGQVSASAGAAQAAQALTALGYSPSEAASAVSKLDSSLPVEDLIRLALKSFAD